MNSQTSLEAAYATCRSIAKREAKNFYYGFMALPKAKSDAMCAVYAFMRRADDISDDESLPILQRRILMRDWLTSFHQNQHVQKQDQPVFLAVRDVQMRFGIDDQLLDELVQGTAMDLSSEPPSGVIKTEVNGRSFDAYQSTDALEGYCYLVASVVGLVTIRIFGFSDAKANEYAVDLGKAFQFTNILRDIREDAERGRVYLPLDILHRHDSNLDAIVDAASGKPLSPKLRNALQELSERAENFYKSTDALIPLLTPESRAAMRVLITIYHALLQKIQTAHYDVFSVRQSVSTPRKLAILLKGLTAGAFQRMWTA